MILPAKRGIHAFILYKIPRTIKQRNLHDKRIGIFNVTRVQRNSRGPRKVFSKPELVPKLIDYALKRMVRTFGSMEQA
jgi:hypothetical protein